MFERRCPRCGKSVRSEWIYCPYCGYYLRGIYRRDLFDSIFQEIERSISEIFRSDLFKMPSIFEELEELERPLVRRGGISIRIERKSGMKPKVFIKTFGDYKKLEPEIRKRLKLTEGVIEAEEEKVRKIPKVTEEPEVKIENKGLQTIITVELPDVEREEDVEIKRLEQSIEIKAYTDEKAYFKIIPLPKEKRIVKEEFKKGKLKIVLE
ncbi:MAG: zinc ribbon domain-containing protein [Candidatus Aenigmarchaeota archaeon]|nr:zinc ribbon domain-containing protein [Candidatus Aenigmarchaeota archaeon]